MICAIRPRVQFSRSLFALRLLLVPNSCAANPKPSPLLSSRRLYHQSAGPRGGNIFSSLAARNEYMPHLSPQDLTLRKSGQS